MRNKVGLFVGCFDPIHNSHIQKCNYLLERKILDEIWLSCAENSLLKKNLQPLEHRIEMCQLALSDNGKSQIRMIHFGSIPDESAVVEKLLEYKKEHDFYLIAGLDKTLRASPTERKLSHLFPCIVLGRRECCASIGKAQRVPIPMNGGDILHISTLQTTLL